MPSGLSLRNSSELMLYGTCVTLEYFKRNLKMFVLTPQSTRAMLVLPFPLWRMISLQETSSTRFLVVGWGISLTFFANPSTSIPSSKVDKAAFTVPCFLIFMVRALVSTSAMPGMSCSFKKSERVLFCFLWLGSRHCSLTTKPSGCIPLDSKSSSFTP